MRHLCPSLHGGSYHAIDVDAADCFVYAREADGERYIIALNFSAEPHNVAITTGETAKIILSTHMDREENINLKHLSLRPFEGVLVKLK